ncbi:MAG: pyrimidine dimer DNA glycosylase/endonuclease V [Sulfolobales archaeon]
MRLWSLHPRYLDRTGLVALWGEGILAQKVLEGRTRGYVNHPQLIRFKNTPEPLLAIGTYLYHVYLEGLRRGYKFNPHKIKIYDASLTSIIPVTTKQVRYEFKLLLYKLMRREPKLMQNLKDVKEIEVNPIFYVIEGPVAEWEKPRDILLKELNG